MAAIRILVIGIGNPVPSFIHRRLSSLIKSGMNLTVVAEHGQVLGISGIEIVRIGGSQSIFQKFLAIIKAFLAPHVFFRLLSSRPELSLKGRVRWAIKYLPLARITFPNVIHLQWIALASDFEWLRFFFKCPIIGSARGSQVTVYPVTRPGFKAVIERALQLVDYIHCVSSDMAQACLNLGATKEKLFVNYNGINLDLFTPKQLSRSSETFTLISVGALMWRKGCLYQLEMLRKLRASDRNVHLVLAGDGPDREGLHYTAHRLGVSQFITFAGKVDSVQLPQMLTQCDAYISTSLAEGLANSVVEAAACGLPILAFDCEGMSEIVEPATNGYTLPFGNVDTLVEKVCYLIDHPDQRRQMGEASRRLVNDRFDERRWLPLMISKYESIGTK